MIKLISIQVSCRGRSRGTLNNCERLNLRQILLSNTGVRRTLNPPLHGTYRIPINAKIILLL